jgi:hypothetical protein
LNIVGKRGEAVLVRQAQDLALAAHDAVEHVVEAHRELADLVLVLDRHVSRVVALLHAVGRFRQAVHGARDAARDHEASPDEHRQSRQREPEERRADAPEGCQPHRERFLQDRDDVGVGA